MQAPLHVLSRLILLGVVWSAASAAGHAQVATGPGRSPIVIRPDGSTARALQWVEAVLAHEPGVSDAATTTVSRWAPADVRNLLVEIDSIRRILRDPSTSVFPLPIEFDRGSPQEIRYSTPDRRTLVRAADQAHAAGLNDADLVARAIVLHSDIALLEENGAGVVLHHSDGQATNVVPQTDHWGMARDLERTIDKRVGRDPDLTAWYHATLARMAAHQQWNAAHAERALSRFPDSAELQFMVGCLHEYLATPRVQAVLSRARLAGNMRVRVGSERSELASASERLKRAVELSNGGAEARLHYGRVLTLAGRPGNAVEELRRAAGALRDPAQQYYGQMFLGAALEASNRTDAARTAYRAAATLFPLAQAPLLALNHLATSTGDREGAATALQALAALPASEESRPDPWWTYASTCGRNSPELLAEAYRRLVTPRGSARQ